MGKKCSLGIAVQILLCVVFMLASCQKENVPAGVGQTDELSIRFAEEVTIKDNRSWGPEVNWLGPNGKLFMLGKQQLPEKSPELFSNVPDGILLKESSYLYITIVGKAASFNNVLGYYYYTPETEFTREDFLNQVFESYDKKVTFKNIICTDTHSLTHGMTFELSMDGEKFPAGTVVGFCLYPHAGSYSQETGVLPNIKMQNGLPIFITTNPEFNNKTALSHVVGQSSLGDFVFAFEDRNSSYSGSSDNDFNDLVFVVGDALSSREVHAFSVYKPNSSPFYFADNISVTKIKRIASAYFSARSYLGDYFGYYHTFIYDDENRLTELKIHSIEYLDYKFIYHQGELAAVEKTESAIGEAHELNRYLFTRFGQDSIAIQHQRYVKWHDEWYDEDRWDTIVLNNKNLMIKKINENGVINYSYDEYNNLISINGGIKYEYDLKPSILSGVNIPSWFWVYDKSIWNGFAGKNNPIDIVPYLRYQYDADNYPVEIYSDENLNGKIYYH